MVKILNKGYTYNYRYVKLFLKMLNLQRLSLNMFVDKSWSYIIYDREIYTIDL